MFKKEEQQFIRVYNFISIFKATEQTNQFTQLNKYRERCDSYTHKDAMNGSPPG